jgi:hypothetical protein
LDRSDPDHGAAIVIQPEVKSFGPPYELRQVYGETASHLPSSLSLAERRIDPLGSKQTSELVTDVSVGSDNSLRFELFSQPQDAPGFLAPSVFYQHRQPDLTNFQSGQSDTSFDRLGGQFVVGLTPDSIDEARLGLVAGTLYSGTYPNLQGRFEVAEASVTRNTEDFAVAPTKGGHASAEALWHLDAPDTDSQFPQIKLEAATYRTIWRNGVAFIRTAAGSSFGYQPSIPDQFSLGGFGNIGILRPGELNGDAFYYTAVGYRHRLFSIPFLAGAVYGMSFYETGGLNQINGQSTHADDVSFGILADTKLGPFWIGASIASGRYTSLQFVFGRF